MDLTPNVVKDKLHRLFSNAEGLKLALLFGSLATGRFGPRSDVDIALLFNGLSSREMVRATAGLNGEISLALGYDDIDTVLLNGLDNPLLKMEIVRTGIALFEDDPFSLLFATRARAEYFDHQIFQKKQAWHREVIKGGNYDIT